MSALVEAIATQGLLTREEIETVSRLPEAVDDGPALGKAVVRGGWLTRWQLEELVSGRGGGLRVGPYVLREPLHQAGPRRRYLARHLFLDQFVELLLVSPDDFSSPSEI